MAGKAAKDLLDEERGSVMSRALEAFPLLGFDLQAYDGMEPRRIIAKLLDYVIGQDEGENEAALKGLTDIAAGLCENGMAWNYADGFWQALMFSIFEYLDGRSDNAEISRISGRLLRAQTRVFEAYLAAEDRKREILAQHLREVDRFPDTIAATLDPPTLTRVGIERMRDLVHAGKVTILSVGAQRRLSPTAGDFQPDGAESPVFELKGQAALKLHELGDPYWEGPGEDSSCLGGLRKIAGEGAVLLVPMIVRGRTTGIVSISDGPERKRFKAEEIELAVRFASRLAVALENAILHDREQRKIKETVALLEITRAINSTLDLREILAKVVQMTVDLCGVVMCVFYLREETHGRFIPAASYGFMQDDLRGDVRNADFLSESMDGSGLAMLKKGEPLALKPSQVECLLPAYVMQEHGVDLVFIYPLTSKEKLSGIFALFYPCRESVYLDRDEIEVVRAIAAQASMAIENAALYEDIERSYFSTVLALAKAIEVKDPYTHGHSERVTEYALMIADAMRLEERERQKLKYAATLHDIGKIGIAGRVLNKPGSLTDEEYSHVKTHPALGDSIIEPVEFLQGPRPIILHHHEHYNGKGYPMGLKGKDIPLCARILSVADAFEAMRSDRPYRRALPLEKAREELLRNAGTQFDPDVVKIFLNILDMCGGDPVNR